VEKALTAVNEAARRGRAGDDDGVFAPPPRLIRAASRFKDGGRTADDGRSGFGACIDACNELVELDMVVRLKLAIAPNQSTDNNITSIPHFDITVSRTPYLSNPSSHRFAVFRHRRKIGR
jgi:hypothetical protein